MKKQGGTQKSRKRSSICKLRKRRVRKPRRKTVKGGHRQRTAVGPRDPRPPPSGPVEHRDFRPGGPGPGQAVSASFVSALSSAATVRAEDAIPTSEDALPPRFKVGDMVQRINPGHLVITGLKWEQENSSYYYTLNNGQIIRENLLID